MSSPRLSSITELKTKCQELSNAEAQRSQLIEQLFMLVEHAEGTTAHLQDEVERLQKHERYDRAEIKALAQAKKDLQARLDTAPFVVVLVDGDNTLFLDDFVKAGVGGGHDAAHLLDSQLKEFFMEVCDWKQHWQVIVRIFANFSGLAKAYYEAGVVSDPRVVRDFLVAFNREFPLFEFVDAGGDKEAADRKIQENFKLYRCVEHCKHIMLASSGDRGYVTFLRPYSANTTGLSLLKSLPFPPDFGTLAVKFAVKEFGDIFKVDKLTLRARTLLVEGGSQVTYAAAMLSPPRTTAAGWIVSQQSESTAVPIRSLQEPAQEKKICLNKHGERLDEPKAWDPDRVKALIPAKLCLKFFLDTCEKTGNECQHEHKYKGISTLSAADKQALSRLARSRPCFSSLHCADRHCLYGHECVHGVRCTYGIECKFSQEMHNVDREGEHYK